MKKAQRKILVLLMIFCMTFTMVPSLAFAGAEPADASTAEEQVTEKTEEATEVPEEKPEGEETGPAEEEKTPEAVVEPEQGTPEETETAEPAAKEDSVKETENKEEKTAEEELDELLDMNVEAKRVIPGTSGVKYTATKYPPSNVIYFKSTLNGKTYKGTCNECDVAYRSSGTMTVTPLGKNDLRRKVAYKYGSWLDSDNRNERNYDMSGIYKGMCLECMMQYARAWEDDKKAGNGSTKHRDFVIKEWKKSPANGGNSWSTAICNKIIAPVKALNKKTADQIGIPGRFRAYFGAVKNTKDDEGRVHGQDPVFWGNLVTGSLKVKKVAKNPSAVQANPALYSLKGAKYQLYTDSACKNKATDVNWKNALLTTKADGTTNAITLEVGTYYIKEITASKGYKIETNSSGKALVTKITINEDKTITFTSKEPEKPDPTPKYGAPDFRVYKTDPTGTFDWDQVGAAEFTVKFFEGVEEKDDIDLEDETADSWTFRTSKKSAPEGAPADTFWSGFDWATDTPIASTRDFYHPKDFKTTSTDTTTRVLPKGWFAIEETKSPLGFKLTDRIYYGWIDENGAVHYEEPSVDGQLQKQVTIVKDEIIDNFAYKVDSDTEENLSGAVLAILDSNNVTMETWTTDSEPHAIGGLEDGSYILREISAPYGYELSDDVPFTVEEGVVKGEEEYYEEDSVLKMSDSPVTVETTAVSVTTNSKTGEKKNDEVIRDTVVVEGLIEGRTYRLEGKLMNKRTGQIVTDKDGNDVIVSSNPFEATDSRMSIDMDFEFDATKLMDNDSVVVYEKLFRTSAVHDETVPAEGVELAKHEDLEDEGQTVTYPSISVIVKKLDSSTGVALPGARLQIVQGDNVKADWTTDDKDHSVEDLTPGDYVLREISAPYGYEIADDVPFSFDGISSTIVTMNNTPVTVGTTAVSASTGKHLGTRTSSETITDTVHMTGLVVGRTYRLDGKLMNERTEEAISGATASKSFTATAETMDVTMDLTFDATSLADGDHVVVFEKLYRTTVLHNETSPVELGKHEDFEDESQTVRYPGISTVAMDQTSETQNLLAGPNATIVDTVNCEGLIEGETYTLEGSIFDKTANSFLEVTGTSTFTPEDEDETTTMTFTFDASGLENHTLVVYETLKLGSTVLAEHKNPNDTAQTIYVPKVGTTATDIDTEDHLSNADTSVTIKDAVKCENLIVGREYTITGKLVYKDNGNDVLDEGSTVTATTTFTATAATMTEDLTFTFNGAALAGKTVVAFETLSTEDMLVGSHQDLTDEGQSVHLPKVATTALDSETNDHISLGDESITIKDTVRFENLVPNKTYTVTGTLMDKLSGAAVSGVTSQPVEFTPTTADGSVVVTFVFNGTDWKNHKTVAFEKLYLGTAAQIKDENLIASHEDIDDTEQTVQIPEIGTTLLDSETKDHIAYGDTTVTLTDTVAYNNLVVGKEYVATGTLMNKATGEPVKVNGADVTASQTFTATAENGTVDVVFTFDGAALPGETVVAFETVTYRDVPVAIHANLNDNNQAVTIPKIRTTASLQNDYTEVKDVITYNGLLENKHYVFKGWLVDTNTGAKIPGSDGTAQLDTDASVSGQIDVILSVDGSASTQKASMTAFEELYVVETIDGHEQEILVAEHKDVNDAAQTVHFGQDIKIRKEVTGNLGDLTKVFEYTAEFTGLEANKAYTVEGDDAKTFTSDAEGKATVSISLKDEQEVAVKDLPVGSTYKVTEKASDHVAQYKLISDAPDKTKVITVSAEGHNTDAAKALSTAVETIDFTDGTIVILWKNNRDLATLTAVSSYLYIWWVAMGLVATAIVGLIMRRRKYAEEE